MLEERTKMWIGLTIEDQEAGIDRRLDAIKCDINGVGVAAKLRVGLEQSDVVALSL